MKTLTKTAGLLATIAISLFATSCRKDNSSVSSDVIFQDSIVIVSPTQQTPPPPTTDAYSHVQFVNASPDAGGLTLYVAGQENGFGNNLYGETRGYYNTTPSVPRESVIIKNESGNTVVSTSSGFYAGQYFSLFYMGEGNNKAVRLFSDNLPSTPQDPNTALIKFTDAAPSSPGLDVTLNGTIIVEAVGYPGNSPYFAQAPGTFTMNFLIHGTKTIVATIPVAVFEANHAYTFYVQDNIQNGKVGLSAAMYTVK